MANMHLGIQSPNIVFFGDSVLKDGSQGLVRLTQSPGLLSHLGVGGFGQRTRLS